MNPSRRKLLFITQKIHQDDDDLAFVILWVREFIKQGMDVSVICLEKRSFDGTFPVYSLGKESGAGSIRRIWNFFRLIFRLDYDAVFVHMNPEYFTLGGWYWFVRRIPMYLWYTHYTTHIHLKLAALFSRRMFAATPQSLPQYNHSPKKVVTGHGIDIDYWAGGMGPEGRADQHRMLSVHRICRSKRIDVAIRSLLHLPKEYTLTIYGRDVEKDYAAELRNLVDREGLRERVTFAGPVPMAELASVYPRYGLMINLAYETIDKTMLESMVFGVYPVTTRNNSIAIGLPTYPEDDSSEAVAQFIRGGSWKPYDRSMLLGIVRSRHSLAALVGTMLGYIRSGT